MFTNARAGLRQPGGEASGISVKGQSSAAGRSQPSLAALSSFVWLWQRKGIAACAHLEGTCTGISTNKNEFCSILKDNSQTPTIPPHSLGKMQKLAFLTFFHLFLYWVPMSRSWQWGCGVSVRRGRGHPVPDTAGSTAPGQLRELSPSEEPVSSL